VGAKSQRIECGKLPHRGTGKLLPNNLAIQFWQDESVTTITLMVLEAFIFSQGDCALCLFVGGMSIVSPGDEGNSFLAEQI